MDCLGMNHGRTRFLARTGGLMSLWAHGKSTLPQWGITPVSPAGGGILLLGCKFFQVKENRQRDHWGGERGRTSARRNPICRKILISRVHRGLEGLVRESPPPTPVSSPVPPAAPSGAGRSTPPTHFCIMYRKKQPSKWCTRGQKGLVGTRDSPPVFQEGRISSLSGVPPPGGA